MTLAVVAKADAALAYQWFKDGSAIAGATSSSLSLTNVQASAAGAYWVELTSAGTQVTSQQAILTVNLAPQVIAWPTDVVVSLGGAAAFTVEAKGPNLAYHWWHDASLITGATNATLTIESALASAAGGYQVEVINSAGWAVSPSFQLKFKPGLGNLKITLNPHQSVLIRSIGLPGMFYYVNASADLVNWTFVGAVGIGIDGWFEFDDKSVNGSSARYYRISLP